MDLKGYVKLLKVALIAKGEKQLNANSSDWGPLTQAAVDKYDIVVTLVAKAVKPIVDKIENPAYAEAKKYAGSKETDSKFNAFLSAFWAKLGLHYKTIIGSSFAWCGLFVFAMNTQVGQKVVSGAAGAKNWAVYGAAIDWKHDGIPHGAVIHLNHDDNCKSAADNHVSFADGDCTVEDLTKTGATIAVFGGNQSNQVKRSVYPAAQICEVRWPLEVQKPAKIEKSVNCTGAAATDDTIK